MADQQHHRHFLYDLAALPFQCRTDRKGKDVRQFLEPFDGMVISVYEKKVQVDRVGELSLFSNLLYVVHMNEFSSDIILPYLILPKIFLLYVNLFYLPFYTVFGSYAEFPLSFYLFYLVLSFLLVFVDESSVV